MPARAAAFASRRGTHGRLKLSSKRVRGWRGWRSATDTGNGTCLRQQSARTNDCAAFSRGVERKLGKASVLPVGLSMTMPRSPPVVVVPVSTS